MSIRREALSATDNFTIVPNDWIRDDRLSWRARGLLAYLLSHREGWEVSLRDLARRGREGRDAVETALQELEQVGYLRREQQRRHGGRFAAEDYVVSEPAAIEDAAPHPGNPTSAPAQTPGPGRETRDGRPGRRSPRPGKPDTVKPDTGKPTTQKTISSEDHRPEDKHPSSSPTAAPREDVESLCVRLADHIEANGSHRPTITKTWRDEARRLLDRDGADLAKALNLVDWCQADPFWRANVLSMPKFREKYDQLRLKAIEEYERQRAAAQRPGARPTPLQRVLDIDALGARMAAEDEARRAMNGASMMREVGA